MARHFHSCSLLCLLALSTSTYASNETLTFQHSPSGGFEAVIDGFSDGPGCSPEFQAAVSVDVGDSAITITSPEDDTGCFLPYTAPPYRVVAELGPLPGHSYEVVWTQSGLTDLAGVLVPAAVGNLVANPEFDDGSDGWSLVNGGGAVALDDSIGVPESPSLHLVGNSAQSSCIVIDDSVPVDLRVLVKPDAGIVDAIIQPYSDVACTSALDPATAESRGSNGSWQSMALTDAALTSGTHSVRIVLNASLDGLGTMGDAHFDHVGFGQAGSVPDGIYFQQEGLTGTWYDASTSGQGFEFVIASGGAAAGIGLFGAWYTYAPGGTPSEQRWYSLQASTPNPGGPTNFTIFRNVGGNFDAPPETTAEAVGAGTLAFYSCTSGLLTYAFDGGLAGSIPVHRLMRNIECDPNGVTYPPAQSDFGFSGAWYDPQKSGQGFVIEINPENGQAFFGWYTYAINGPTDPQRSQRWFSAQAPYTVGAISMDLTLYTSTGGAFAAPDGVTTIPVGTATLTFVNCAEAALHYVFTAGETSGRSGTIALTRLGPPLVSCHPAD